MAFYGDVTVSVHVEGSTYQLDANVSMWAQEDRTVASRRPGCWTMLCLSTGWRLLSQAHRLPPSRPRPAAQSVTMYTTRLYSTSGGGGGGGGGVKHGRRAGLAVMEAPHPPHHHLPHHPTPPPPAYHLYQGRPDAHRGAHFYHPQPAHLAPPQFSPHYQHHAHFHTYGEGGSRGRGRCPWQQEEDVELHP
ncbi:unnamed protein product [Pleuronectes platessa]|uniref:Uncharacterized protein n=1 Tax=Pleuronectes platessa TaxID=8262 RepID=A0A9N7Z6L9_PLEPL|nr:unnamed protein product [Pleuronectes platessa]